MQQTNKTCKLEISRLLINLDEKILGELEWFALICFRDIFDRVEISNPEGLPSGLTTEEFGTKSVVRNPVIASLLNRADYIEQIGTGINRIKNSVKEHGQGHVEFSYNNFFIVTFARTKKVTEKLGENEIKILKSI